MMHTKQVVVSRQVTAEDVTVRRAAAMLRAGELVAFPTETVYGLAADGLSKAAARAVYAAKGRPSDNPLILHVDGREMLTGVAAQVSALEERLIRDFWPGPLTLVFPKTAAVPESVTGGGDTVAVRSPRHPVALALIRAAGVPIAAPSANRSGRPSPTTAEMVMHDLAGRIALVLDAGPCTVGVESTVVACSDGQITIYRPGAVTAEMLSAYGPVVLDPALSGEGIPKAPGMKYRHYSPRVPVTIWQGDGAAVARALKTHYRGDCGYFVSRETAALLPPEAHTFIWGARADRQAMARGLYVALTVLEQRPITEIYAEGVASRELGAAIMNRLAKAAGYHIKEVK